MHQLSFVFQGKTFFNNDYQEVVENIRRVRRLYPRSEIILSTWLVDSDKMSRLIAVLKPLDIKIIFNDDPGALIYQEGSCNWITNINRMLLSSSCGMRSATREYVVKLRTDSYIDNNNLKKIFYKKTIIEKLYPRDKRYTLFEERMINCNLFARHSRSYRPFLFHPGDIMLLGKREDMIELYSIPLADYSIFSTIFKFSIFSLMHYVPEQYIWVNYIKRKVKKFSFLGNKQFSKKKLSLSEQFYINNFIPLSCEQLGFVWPKHRIKYNEKGYGTIYQFSDWRQLNRIYSGKRNCRYPLSFRITVFMMKLLYFILYLPLRWKVIRRAVMNLKSRE